MRLQKYILCTILLFANLFLLAHGFVPHIHHDGIICITQSNIRHNLHGTDCEKKDGCGTCHKHKHCSSEEDHTSTDECDLKVVLQRQGGENQSEVLRQLQSHLDYPLFYLLCNAFCLEASHVLAHNKIDHPVPWGVDNYISPFIGISLDLRAPPVYFLG